MFPAGYPGTGTFCPGTYLEAVLPRRTLDPGTTTLGGGQTLIRNKLVMDISYAWHSVAEVKLPAVRAVRPDVAGRQGGPTLTTCTISEARPT